MWFNFTYLLARPKFLTPVYSLLELYQIHNLYTYGDLKIFDRPAIPGIVCPR